MNEIEVKAENNSSGVTVVGSDAPTDYHVAPRADVAGSPAISPPSTAVGLMKKRGRPRKYGPAGPVTVALRAKPISAAGPAGVIDFSAQKRPKIKPAATVASAAATTVVKQHQPKFETENIGERVSGSVGANFTPHIITVNAGEDVMMKVISFSQQGPRAICILSANGMISSVTLRQPSSSGGTLTYEGRFEILSLMGSFTPSERGGIRNRSGGLSVSLASPDGRVIGGGVAGMLIASSPVQIVVGSFLAPGNQHEEKPKKQKSDYIISGPPTSTVNFSSVGLQENYVVQRHPAPAIGYSSFREDTRNGSTDLNDS